MHLCAERKKDTPDDCLFDSATPKKTGLTQFKLNFSLIITKGKEREREKKRFAFNELEKYSKISFTSNHSTEDHEFD